MKKTNPPQVNTDSNKSDAKFDKQVIDILKKYEKLLAEMPND